MEGILFWECRLLNGGYFILGRYGAQWKVFYFGKIGCLMEGILFCEDRVLNGRYFVLGR